MEKVEDVLSIEQGSGARGRRISEKVGQNLILVVQLQKWSERQFPTLEDVWRGFQTPKCRNKRDIQKYVKVQNRTLLSQLLKNINFRNFANYQLSCFIQCRQSALSDLRPNFWRIWTKTTFNRMRKTKQCRYCIKTTKPVFKKNFQLWI